MSQRADAAIRKQPRAAHGASLYAADTGVPPRHQWEALVVRHKRWAAQVSAVLNHYLQCQASLSLRWLENLPKGTDPTSGRRGWHWWVVSGKGGTHLGMALPPATAQQLARTALTGGKPLFTADRGLTRLELFLLERMVRRSCLQAARDLPGGQGPIQVSSLAERESRVEVKSALRLDGDGTEGERRFRLCQAIYSLRTGEVVGELHLFSSQPVGQAGRQSVERYRPPVVHGDDRFHPLVASEAEDDSDADIEVVLRVILGSVQLSPSQVTSLSTGDVIVLTSQTAEPLYMHSGDGRRFLVQPGRIGDRLAVQVVDHIGAGVGLPDG